MKYEKITSSSLREGRTYLIRSMSGDTQAWRYLGKVSVQMQTSFRGKKHLGLEFERIPTSGDPSDREVWGEGFLKTLQYKEVKNP